MQSSMLDTKLLRYRSSRGIYYYRQVWDSSLAWEGNLRDNTQAIAIALVCPRKLDVETLFQKTPHILATRYGEIQLALIKSFFPDSQFLQYRKLLHRLCGQNVIKSLAHLLTLRDISTTNLTGYAHGRKNDMKVMGLANCFLTELKTYFSGGNLFLVRQI